MNNPRIAITGVGCVSPIGTGRNDFLAGLLSKQSAIRVVQTLSDRHQTTSRGAQIEGFEGKQFVKPRKAIKVMSREVQLAFAAAQLAWQDAFPDEQQPDPDRIGVVFGSEMLHGDIGDVIPAVQACMTDGALDIAHWGTTFGKQIYPLWMLKNLPNMPACHVGIAVDARGPNNTIAQEEVSGLLALSEATQVIRRGAADTMLVGAVGSRLTPTRLSFRPGFLYDEHPLASSIGNEILGAAFDQQRGGIVPSEGAVTLAIEELSAAESRGAQIQGFVRCVSSAFGRSTSEHGGSRQAISQAITAALRSSGVGKEELSHISAQGFAGKVLDGEEAAGILAAVGPDVPVCIASSYYGSAGAASSLMHLVASLLSVQAGTLFPAVGFTTPDADCPLDIVREPRKTDRRCFLQVSFTPEGHASAAVIQCNSPTT